MLCEGAGLHPALARPQGQTHSELSFLPSTLPFIGKAALMEDCLSLKKNVTASSGVS